MTAIKAQPTDGLCYSPSEDLYWSAEGLAKEVERVFDICHGCRLCFNLCPSFPTLFDAVDREGGDVRKLTAADNDAVVDGCFQCKLCYVKCPYTPDDGHEFKLDFPRLMLRYTAQQAKKNGISLRDKFLGNPMLLGKMSAPAAPLVNRMNRAKSHRVLMEKTLGIHRDKLLPDFASEPFEKWFAKRANKGGAASGVNGTAVKREAVLFHTCYVNYNAPEIGKDAVEVLERSGVRVLSPTQTCCGMPALDGGDIEFARKQARANIETLRPYVEKGLPVLVVNPTCSYMLKKEIVDLVGKDMAEPAKKLAAATRDLGEFLFELKRAGELDTSFKSSPGAIAYHVPCHLEGPEHRLSLARRVEGDPGRHGAAGRPLLRTRRHLGDEARALRGIDANRQGRVRRDVGGWRDDHGLPTRRRAVRAGHRPPAASPGADSRAGLSRKWLRAAAAERGGEVMKPVSPAEIKTLGDYELARDAFRQRVIGDQGRASRARERPPHFSLREPRHRALPDPRDAARGAHRRAQGDRPRDSRPTTI